MYTKRKWKEKQSGTKKILTPKCGETKNKKVIRNRKQVEKWQKIITNNKVLNVNGLKSSIKGQVLAEWNKIETWYNPMLLQECHFRYKYTNILKFKGPSYKL